MRRTRKWSFVAQEATRLAALKLSPREIAKRLEVNKSTVTRWMVQGKLPRLVPSTPTQTTPVLSGMSPAAWAKSVRAEYALDTTDDQLVTLGEAALALTRDVTVTAAVRLTASGRFQAIVRQLALVMRRADHAAPPAPVAVVPIPAKRHLSMRRPGVDPRLRAVK